MGSAIGLTGEDLTVDDVWAVAVEGATAELTDGAPAGASDFSPGDPPPHPVSASKMTTTDSRRTGTKRDMT